MTEPVYEPELITEENDLAEGPPADAVDEHPEEVDAQ